MAESRSVQETIQEAERLLPGVAAPDGEVDPRWQAIIHVGYFIQTNPDEVWQFIARWGAHDDKDLRTAIATCLLEHLLGERFEEYFPKVQAAARDSALFADMFTRCWKLGEAEQPDNAQLWESLVTDCLGRARPDSADA